MSNPVIIQIRGTEEVREEWEDARGQFDMTHGEFAEAASQFVKERDGEFERFLKSEERGDESNSETRGG